MQPGSLDTHHTHTMSPSSPVIDHTPSIPPAPAAFPDDHKSDIEKASPGGSVLHGEAVDGVINPEKGGHANLARTLSRYHITFIGFSSGIGTGASAFVAFEPEEEEESKEEEEEEDGGERGAQRGAPFEDLQLTSLVCS